MLKEINNPDKLAIEIIKRIKSLVEIKLFIQNIKEKKNIYKKIINDIIEYPSNHNKKFSLELWESNNDFYENLFEYSNSQFKKVLDIDKLKLKYLPKSSFAINGLLNLLDFLLRILEIKKDAYRNDKIKFIINILCEILTDKNKKILNNNIFYEGSIFELKNNYKDVIYNVHNKLIEKMNIIYKDIFTS